MQQYAGSGYRIRQQLVERVRFFFPGYRTHPGDDGEYAEHHWAHEREHFGIQKSLSRCVGFGITNDRLHRFGKLLKEICEPGGITNCWVEQRYVQAQCDRTDRVVENRLFRVS